MVVRAPLCRIQALHPHQHAAIIQRIIGVPGPRTEAGPFGLVVEDNRILESLVVEDALKVAAKGGHCRWRLGSGGCLPHIWEGGLLSPPQLTL